MMDCIFCKIVKGEIPCTKVAENDDFLAFLDIQPITEGHTLVVPKHHFRDFSEFPENLGNAYVRFVKQTMALLQRGLAPDGINIGMNNGAAAGQAVFHQHTHLIPRRKNDGLKSWPGQASTPAAIEQVRRRIVGPKTTVKGSKI